MVRDLRPLHLDPVSDHQLRSPSSGGLGVADARKDAVTNRSATR